MSARLAWPARWVLLFPALALVCASAAGQSPAQPFQFAVIGDRTGRAVPGVHEAIWKEVCSRRPAFIVTIGDHIEGPGAGDLEQQWRDYLELIRPYRNIPVYFTPGNHDVFSDASAHAFTRNTGQPLQQSFDYAGAHFVILDNSRSLELDEPQLAFLEQDLARNAGKSPKFVFFHKPYWLIPLKFHSSQFRLHELAQRYRVNFVISGHTHQFTALRAGPVTYVVVGSSGASLERGLSLGQGFDEGWFFQYLWISVDKTGRVHVTTCEAAPPYGKGRRILLERRLTTQPIAFKVSQPPAH